MRPRTVVVLVALAVIAAGVGLYVYASRRKPALPLVLYCAAGIQKPVEAAVRDYEKEYGIRVQIQYGGSGTLLSNLRVARSGDLYLAADESYLKLAREQGLLAEAIPLARIRPVIAVPKGNPKNLRALEDLWREDVRLALANPDAASVGRTVKELLEKTGQWAKLEKHAKVLKPTVGDVANDVKIGTVDAGVVWDATVLQYPELDAIHLPLFDTAEETINVGVLTFCEQPAAALRLARYLGAPDRGLAHFEQLGYQPVDGDQWAETPEILLFSGATNREAIEGTVKRFQEREGVVVKTVFNGCGILVGQMKTGERPDAYLTCDRSFVSPVEELFAGDPVIISETNVLIAVAKGNPHGIKSLADLARQGLRVGLANAEQSTLGALTKRLLEKEGVLKEVMANVRTQVPTADMLVNQLQIGSLDAVVVYDSSTVRARDKLDLVPLNDEGTLAVQTFSVGKESRYRRLAGRLLDVLRSNQSRERYEKAGFRWRGPETNSK